MTKVDTPVPLPVVDEAQLLFEEADVAAAAADG